MACLPHPESGSSLPQTSTHLRFTGTCCSLSVRSYTSLTAHASLVRIRWAIMDFLSQRRSLCILTVDIVDVDCPNKPNGLEQSGTNRSIGSWR